MDPEETQQDDEKQQAHDEQADGYYGEDDMEMGDLDLSFLDDEDEEEDPPHTA